MMLCAPILAMSAVPGSVTIAAAPVVVRAQITVARIQNAVAAFYGLPLIEMSSQRRSPVVARPRQVAMYLAKQLTPKSLPNIGKLFGGRDHSTVIHAVRRVEMLMAIDADFAADVRVMRGVLETRGAQA